MWILSVIWGTATFAYHCVFQKWMLPLLTVVLHSSATYTMVWASHWLCNPSIMCPLQQLRYLLLSGSSEVLLQMKYISTTLTSYCTTRDSHWFCFKSPNERNYSLFLLNIFTACSKTKENWDYRSLKLNQSNWY